MPLTFTRADIISQTTFAQPNDPRAQVLELIEQSKTADVSLHRYMQAISHNVKGHDGRPKRFSRGPLKTKTSIARKVGIIDWDNPTTDRQVGKTPLEVKDIARATIVFSTVAEMMAVRDYIYTTEEFQLISKKQSPAVKDLWSKGVNDQYKDVKFFLAMKILYNNTQIIHIVELQLNVTQMDRGKKYGHAFYNVSRLGMTNGVNEWRWDDPRASIVIPGAVKGDIGGKLRTALTHIRSMAVGNQRIWKALDIISYFLQHNLRVKDTLVEQKEVNGRTVTRERHNAFLNGRLPVRINAGPYDWQTGGITTGPAQSWAIATLAAFVFSEFTRYQGNVYTRTAINMHEQH